jgi:hypothetical protein
MALKIDDKIVHATATEVIMQNGENFTNGTNGAITVSSEAIMGDLEATSMLGEIANIIGGRDISASSDAVVKQLATRDENNIKLYWGTGAIEFKVVDATRYGSDAEAFSVAIGEQIGKGIVMYMLNGAVAGLVGSISSQGDLITGDGASKVTHSLLNNALIPFGDARDSIVCWVMNGKTYADLVDAGLGIATSNVAGGVVADGSVGTLGRPVYMTDSTSLAMKSTDGNDTDSNGILGLSQSAINVVESASRTFANEIITGKENIMYRIQGEGEFLLNIKGYSWNTDAGTNPSLTALATKDNWTKKATDAKATAGILLNVA